MINKMSFLKFSLLLCITGSNFGVIKAQDVEVEKPSIGKQVVEWVRANKAKTLAIAAITGVVIGGGIYGGSRLYKSSQEEKPKKEEQRKKEVMSASKIFEFLKDRDLYKDLSEEEKQKTVKEFIKLFNYADSLFEKNKLPSYTQISAAGGLSSQKGLEFRKQIVNFIDTKMAKKLANRLKVVARDLEKLAIINDEFNKELEETKDKLKKEDKLKQEYPMLSRLMEQDKSFQDQLLPSMANIEVISELSKE